MTNTASTTLRGRALLNGQPLRCPGTRPGLAPHRLTLMTSGRTVVATCGGRHGDTACLWPVPALTPADITTLAARRPGPIRIELPGGRLEGRIARPRRWFPHRARPATGKPPAPAAKATPGRRAGGTAAEAFRALGAVAGAVGDTAKATASIASSSASIAREGIRAADTAAARRFAGRHARDEG